MRENSLGEGGDLSPKDRTRRQIPEALRGEPRIAKEINEKQVEGVSSRKQSGELNNHEGTTLEQRHQDWPKINVTVCFTYHSSAQDAAKAREQMYGKQIYFYEAPGGKYERIPLEEITDPEEYPDEKFESDIANTSLGSIPIEQSFLGPILRTLHKSGIVVKHADLRETETRLRESIEEAIERPYQERSLGKTLSNFARKMTDIADGQERRDDIIVDRIEEELGDVFEQHPDLQEKEEVDVLITMGIQHRRSLGDKLRARGISITEVVDGYDDLYMTKIERELGEGNHPSRELLLQGYLELFLAEHLAFAERRSDTYEYAKRVTSYFSPTQICWMHDLYYMPGGLNINEFLARKGLPPFPQTNEDLLVSLNKLREDARNDDLE